MWAHNTLGEPAAALKVALHSLSLDAHKTGSRQRPWPTKCRVRGIRLLLLDISCTAFVAAPGVYVCVRCVGHVGLQLEGTRCLLSSRGGRSFGQGTWSMSSCEWIMWPATFVCMLRKMWGNLFLLCVTSSSGVPGRPVNCEGCILGHPKGVVLCISCAFVGAWVSTFEMPLGGPPGRRVNCVGLLLSTTERHAMLRISVRSWWWQGITLNHTFFGP